MALLQRVGGGLVPDLGPCRCRRLSPPNGARLSERAKQVISITPQSQIKAFVGSLGDSFRGKRRSFVLRRPVHLTFSLSHDINTASTLMSSLPRGKVIKLCPGRFALFIVLPGTGLGPRSLFRRQFENIHIPYANWPNVSGSPHFRVSVTMIRLTPSYRSAAQRSAGRSRLQVTSY
ncbi:hypothetical protein IQ07DRAFT_288250 [Pyrenochaeta sp. DS3sAY3a]|nr:hypothetical protein IQ07DRAFT_288250 [Pyrenochaeta sp. DS3sAY3a]